MADWQLLMTSRENNQFSAETRRAIYHWSPATLALLFSSLPEPAVGVLRTQKLTPILVGAQGYYPLVYTLALLFSSQKKKSKHTRG